MGGKGAQIRKYSSVSRRLRDGRTDGWMDGRTKARKEGLMKNEQMLG